MKILEDNFNGFAQEDLGWMNIDRKTFKKESKAVHDVVCNLDSEILDAIEDLDDLIEIVGNETDIPSKYIRRFLEALESHYSKLY